MKKAAVIGIFCIVLGFGAGWLARQGSAPSAEPAVAAKDGERPQSLAPAAPPQVEDAPATATKGDERSGGTSAAEGPSAELQQAAREQQARLRNEMLSRQELLHRDRIAKLVDALGLSTGQAAKLDAFFKSNREKLAVLLAPEQSNDWTAALETAALLRAEGLDELLAGILNDSQEAAYESVKTREHQDRIDARASRSLAKLEDVLKLSAEQKQPVLNLLRHEAGSDLEANPEAHALMAIWEHATGVEMDPEGFGIAHAVQQQLEQAAEAGGTPEDPTSWMTSVKDKLDIRIQQKVHQMSNVLDASQLAAYRQHLQSQAETLGIFQHLADPDAGLVGPK